MCATIENKKFTQHHGVRASAPTKRYKRIEICSLDHWISVQRDDCSAIFCRSGLAFCGCDNRRNDARIPFCNMLAIYECTTNCTPNSSTICQQIELGGFCCPPCVYVPSLTAYLYAYEQEVLFQQMALAFEGFHFGVTFSLSKKLKVSFAVVFVVVNLLFSLFSVSFRFFFFDFDIEAVWHFHLFIYSLRVCVRNLRA